MMAIWNDFGILNPSYGLSIALLGILFIFKWRAQKLRAAALATLTASNPNKTLIQSTLLSIIITLLIVAIMRPFWGWEDIEATTTGDDVIFLVDISRSMYAEDIPPSRIELAKRKMRDLVTVLSAEGSAARFGITVFAGDGYTLCPVTDDRAVLGQFINILSPDLVSSLGSNLKAGITAALGKLDELTLKRSRVIVLSDGEDNFLEVTEVISDIASKGVRVDSIGIGTPAGAAVTLPNGATLRDSARRPVISVLKEDSLKELARAGNGIYTRAVLGDSDVQALSSVTLAAQTDPSIQATSIRTYRELGPWLTLIAILFLLGCAGSRRLNPLLLAPIVFILFNLEPTFAEPSLSDSKPGPRFLKESPFDLYNQGDYTRAASEYSKALERTPNDHSLLFGYASSLYRLGRHEESNEIFDKLAKEARTERELFDSKYNQGNSLLALGRYRDAIDAYWTALDIKPGDPAAKHNLGIARALLEQQLHSTPTPTPTPTVHATESSSSPDSKPTQPPENSPNTQNQPDVSPSPLPEDSSQSATPNPTPKNNTQELTPMASPETTAAATSSPAPDSTTMPLDSTPVTPDSQSEEVVASPTPTERLKEAQQHYPPTTPVQNAPPAPTPYGYLSEADAWLESLPESPLLIRKYRGTPSTGGQTW